MQGPAEQTDSTAKYTNNLSEFSGNRTEDKTPTANTNAKEQDWQTYIEKEVLKQINNTNQKVNGIDQKISDHLNHHGTIVWNDFANIFKKENLGLGFIALVICGVLIFLGKAYFNEYIEDAVNSAINSRQCIPDKPIVSAGAFCIK